MPPQKMERHDSGERRFYSIEEMWWQAKKSKKTLFRRKSFGETRQRQPLHQHEGISVCRLLNKSGINISSRTVCRQLYSRADERFRYKTPNKSCSGDNLERVIDMQMGYLEGMHHAIDQSRCCPQEFYFIDECPLFFGVLP